MSNPITEQEEQLQYLLKAARFARKGDYRTYESFKRKIEALNLPEVAYDTAIRELARVLKV